MWGMCGFYNFHLKIYSHTDTIKNDSNSITHDKKIKQSSDTNCSYKYNLIVYYISVHNYIIVLKHAN